MRIFGFHVGGTPTPVMAQPTEWMMTLGLGMRVAAAVSAIDPNLSKPLSILQTSRYFGDQTSRSQFVAGLTDGGKLDEARMVGVFAKTYGIKTRVEPEALHQAAMQLHGPSDAGAAIMASYAPMWMFESGLTRPAALMKDVVKRIDGLSLRGAATLFGLADPLMMVTHPEEFAELVQLIDMVDSTVAARTFKGRNRITSRSGRTMREALEIAGRDIRHQISLNQNNRYIGIFAALPPLTLDDDVTGLITEGMPTNPLEDERRQVRKDLRGIRRLSQMNLVEAALVDTLSTAIDSPHPIVRNTAREAIALAYRRLAKNHGAQLFESDEVELSFLSLVPKAVDNPLLQGSVYELIAEHKQEDGDQAKAAEAAYEAARAFGRAHDEKKALEMLIRGHLLAKNDAGLAGNLKHGTGLPKSQLLVNAEIYRLRAHLLSDAQDEVSRQERAQHLKERADALRAATGFSPVQQKEFPAYRDLWFNVAAASLDAAAAFASVGMMEQAAEARRRRDDATTSYFGTLMTIARHEGGENKVAMSERFRKLVAEAYQKAATGNSPISESIAFQALVKAEKDLSEAKAEAEAARATKLTAVSATLEGDGAGARS